MKNAYPVIMTQGSEFIVVFVPDFNINTQGVDIPEAMEMAADALCLVLYNKEKSGEIIPPASNVKQVQAETDAEVYLIFCDTVEYYKFYEPTASPKLIPRCFKVEGRSPGCSEMWPTPPGTKLAQRASLK